MYKNFIKELLDFIVASIGLILLSPLFILITFFLFIANNGKPFFVQPRPGKKGKTFSIVKFKTMNDKRNSLGDLLPDADRLTVIGSLVRKTSLDEIPQLINVIKGDMSLIGPRPLLVDYMPYFNEIENKRHDVKPGITGWAQINGRNSISWDKKFEFDVWYVENLSFKLDLLILIKTILKVVKSEGISNEGHVTMPTFIEYCKDNNRTYD